MEKLASDQVMNMISVATLSALPFSRSLWKNIEKGLDNLAVYMTTNQIAIMCKDAIFNKYYGMFPRDNLYYKNLFLWLTWLWDSKGWDGAEVFTPDKGEPIYEIVYKTYMSCDGRSQVTLLESVEGITRGTTGLSSWGAGNVLASWCLGNPDILQGKRVLELGAGIGQTACTVLAYLESKNLPLSYLATDCHPHVLSILHHNLSLQKQEVPPKIELEKFQAKINKLIDSEEIPAGDMADWTQEYDFKIRETASIRVRQLDWRQPCADILITDPPDVILAADVVYARHLLPYLAQVLRCALSGGTKLPDEQVDMSKENSVQMEPHLKTAYIACTRRSQETISEFLNQISLNNMIYSVIFQASLDREEALFGYDESHLPVKIYKIQLSIK